MNKETYFLLIRHGETAWNAEKKLQGQVDIPLNANGIAQAEELAKKIFEDHPDIAPILYSSDLQRAFATAQKTKERFQFEEIIQRRDLRECAYGKMEGMSAEERESLTK